MIVAHIAVASMLLAALFCWRVSRPAAGALLVAFTVSLAWLLTHLEPLRWVSAVVGLVGAWEFGYRAQKRFVYVRGLLNRGYWPELDEIKARGLWGKRDHVALLLFASMVGDGAAYCAWIRLDEWVMPVAQIVVCVAIAAIARWPEGRKA